MCYTCKYLNLLDGILCSTCMSITLDVTATLFCLLIIVFVFLEEDLFPQNKSTKKIIHTIPNTLYTKEKK